MQHKENERSMILTTNTKGHPMQGAPCSSKCLQWKDMACDNILQYHSSYSQNNQEPKSRWC